MLKFLLVVLLAALAAATWFLAAPLGLPSWAPAAAIIAAIAVTTLLVIHAMVRRWLDRRGARRRSRDPEMVALEGYYAQELDRLRIEGAGLPWWIVLGAPGSGKTTALLRSGLDFAESHGPRRFLTGSEVQATDRASFFLAQSAVVIDTPGRLATGEAPEDREAWHLMLQALQRQGPRRPLGAVVMVVSAADLMSDATASDARALRGRLVEVVRELGACPPVYILVSKLDAVVGLERLLGSMPGDRVGFVIEVSGPGADASRRIAEQKLGALAVAVDRVVADCISTFSMSERAEVLRAGAHFTDLAERIEGLVAAVFADHGAVDAPVWRGLFFASAGGPVEERTDPLFKAVMRDFGEPPMRPAASSGPGRQALLQPIFKDVLVGDRWISAWSRGFLRSQEWRRRLRSFVGLAACVGLLVMLTRSADENHRLVGDASGAIAALQEGRPGVLARHSEVAPLQALVHRLERDASQGPPWSGRWGLYQGKRLHERVVPLYHEAVRSRVIDPLVREAATEIERLTRSEGAPGSTTFWPGVDALRFYLYSTEGALGERPEWANDQEWLVTQTARRWGKRAGVSQERAEEFLTGALGDVLTRPKADDDLVQQAKAVLRKVQRGRLWVEELESGDVGVAPVMLSTLAPGASWLENGGRSVPGAFTREGWTKVHERLVDCHDRFIVAAAVIDNRICKDEALKLKDEYFSRYITAWNEFLNRARVREPERGPGFHRELIALIEAIALVDGHTAALSPHERLFKAVADNALLPEDPGPRRKSGGGWIDMRVERVLLSWVKSGGLDPRRSAVTSEATVNTVREALEPFYSYGYRPDGGDSQPLFSAYTARIRPIAGELEQYEKSRDDGSYRKAKEHAKATYDLLYNEHFPTLDPTWKHTLRELLEPPIRALVDAGERGVRDDLTLRWCNDVVAPFDLMSICYPFSSQVRGCDASAAEVRRVFHPQTGALWLLYEDALSRHYPRGTSRYEVAPQGFDDRLKRNPAVADFLTNARELATVLFPDGAEEPRFEFAVKFRPSKEADRVRLTVGSAVIEYNNNFNDTFRPIHWPGEGATEAKLEARLKLAWEELTYPGYWSLFKVLEAGDLRRDGRTITGSFKVGRANITLIIEPATPTATPLYGTRADAKLMDVFRPSRLTPPRQLFTGGRTCPPSQVATAAQPERQRRSTP